MSTDADDPDYRCGRFIDRLDDRRQQYEILGRRREGGDVEVLGWANASAVDVMVETLSKWPRYADVWSVDRQSDDYETERYRTAGELGAEPGEVEP